MVENRETENGAELNRTTDSENLQKIDQQQKKKRQFFYINTVPSYGVLCH